MKRMNTILLWLAFIGIFFIPFLWYTPNHLIMGGDLTFPLNPGDYLVSIFNIWRRVYTGGNSAISLTTVPFYLPMAIFDWLGFSLQTVQKFHFGLWLSLPALSMFYLAGVIFRDHPRKRIAQLIAVCIFLFNTYEVVWADSARMSVWVGLPLIFAFFIQGLNEKKNWLRYAIGIALTSIVTSTAAANPPMFLMFTAIFFFWLLFHFAVTPEDRNWRSAGRIALFIVTAILIALIVNLFWVIPYASVLINEYRGAITSGLAGISFQNWLDPVSTNTSVLNVFRLQGAWDWYAGWNGEPYVPAAAIYQNNPFYLLWSVLVPVLAMTALIIKDKFLDRRVLLFFAFLAILGIMFGAGSHEPTGIFYRWLIDKIPFLSIYRSPWYKFSTWTVLGYSILIAAVLAHFSQWLSDKITEKKKVTLAPYVIPGLIGLFIAGNLIYSSGLVLGKVFPKQSERKRLHSAHVVFPDYFFKAAEWINKQPDDFRILQLPAQEAFNYNWGLGTLMDMSIFTFNKPTIWWPEQTGSGGAKPGSEMTAKSLFQGFYRGQPAHLSQLAGILNVKYLLQKDDIDYSFYGGIDTPEFIKKKITDQGFTLAHTEGPWSFYETPRQDQKPLFFPTQHYIQAEPVHDGLISAVTSASYNRNATYNSLTDQPLPGKEQKGRYLLPSLKDIRQNDGIFTIPLNTPEDNTYVLSFEATEGAQVAIDSKPIALEIKEGLASGTVTLTKGKHVLTVTPTEKPVSSLQNPSFEDGLWEKPFDASRLRPGLPDFSARTISDATDGKQAVEITSSNHSAAMRKGIDNFEANRSYLMSFDYKHIEGNPPKFNLWQEGALVGEPNGELEKNNEWTTHTALVQPRPLSTGAYLFLYADAGEKEPVKTTIQYDNVVLYKLPRMIHTLSLTTALPSIPNTPQITYERNSTTHYTIKVSNNTTPFILNFLEQYDLGWIARINGNDLSNAQHLRAFDYANAWHINQTGDLTIDIIFEPQRTFITVGWISGVAILLSVLYLWNSKRRKTE